MRIGKMQIFYFPKKKDKIYTYFPFYLFFALPTDVQLMFLCVAILAVVYMVQDVSIRSKREAQEKVKRQIETFNQQKKLREIQQAQGLPNANIKDFF